MKKHAEAAGSVLVKADVYLAVLDSASPANEKGLFQTSLDQAWDRVGGPTATGKLDLVNDCVEQYWAHRQAAGELLVWSPGSGVYKVQLLRSDITAMRINKIREGGGFLGKAGSSGIISCPSGGLTICSLKALGEGELVFKVPPGEYRVTLQENEEEIRRHWGLADLNAYEEGAWPDFILGIQPS